MLMDVHISSLQRMRLSLDKEPLAQFLVHNFKCPIQKVKTSLWKVGSTS